MTEDKMKELLFSLAWYDCSCHHKLNAKDILAREFPDADFASSLAEFEKCKTMPPGDGCPR
jgi:hypothetical protein